MHWFAELTLEKTPRDAIWLASELPSSTQRFLFGEGAHYRIMKFRRFSEKTVRIFCAQDKAHYNRDETKTRPVVQRESRDQSAQRQIAARRAPGQEDRAGDERKASMRQDADEFFLTRRV